jgi:hypothetical protein
MARFRFSRQAPSRLARVRFPFLRIDDVRRGETGDQIVPNGASLVSKRLVEVAAGRRMGQADETVGEHEGLPFTMEATRGGTQGGCAPA